MRAACASGAHLCAPNRDERSSDADRPARPKDLSSRRQPRPSAPPHTSPFLVACGQLLPAHPARRQPLPPRPEQGVPQLSWGGPFYSFRGLQGLAGWFGGGVTAGTRAGNRRNKGAISQGGRCGHFGGMYILQEMTMGVTKLENSLVEISQDIELDQRCPLGPPSRCFSLFTTPF